MAVAAGDFEFLLQFAVDGAEVGGAVEVGGVCVAVVDVSADADGHFGVQPRFTAGFAAGVAEHAVAVVQDQVGDELFVRRVVLGGGTGQEEVVGRIEKRRHVAFGVKTKAFKRAQGLEHGAGDDKDVFHRCGHGAEG